MPWQEFRPWFDERWEAGDHVAAVGMTKSGKTTLIRNVLKVRDYVVVMGTKVRDPSLYGPLEAMGFVRRSTWDPWEWEETGERYVIFAPPLDLPDHPAPGDVRRAMTEQAEAFRTALIQIFKAGGWCIYADEILYLADNLGLSSELDLIYLQGRSEGITMVASTQRPRSVPLNVFQQATWFLLWQIADRDDRRRAAEYTGMLSETVFQTVGRLPRHEFVAVNKTDSEIVRSRYQMPR